MEPARYAVFYPIRWDDGCSEDSPVGFIKKLGMRQPNAMFSKPRVKIVTDSIEL